MTKPVFKKAQKSQAKLRLGLVGPSGSGKTYTALAIATHLGGRVAVIDTERGSAALYADRFEFDCTELSYAGAVDDSAEGEGARLEAEADQLRVAILAAAEARYPVLVIDSASHAWQGVKDYVDFVSRTDRRFKGNSWAAWSVGTPIQNALIDAILRYPGHVLVTMRTKTEWSAEKDERTGKAKPVKIGLAPVQRENVDYELTIVLEMSAREAGKGGIATVGKTRFDALAGRVIDNPGAAFARELLDWLEAKPPAAPSTPERDDLLAELMTLAVDLDRAGSPKGPELVAKLNGGALTHASVGALRSLAEKARGYLAETKTAGTPGPSGSPAAGVAPPAANKTPAPDPSLAGAQAGGADSPAPPAEEEDGDVDFPAHPWSTWEPHVEAHVLARLGAAQGAHAANVARAFATPTSEKLPFSTAVFNLLAHHHGAPVVATWWSQVGAQVTFTGSRASAVTMLDAEQLGRVLLVAPVVSPEVLAATGSAS